MELGKKENRFDATWDALENAPEVAADDFQRTDIHIYNFIMSPDFNFINLIFTAYV